MPDVHFARSGDVSVAYSVNGDGPVDIVYVQGAYTHLDVMWELPQFRSFCERLGQFARLIRFDKRGMGMSDRVPGAATLESRMEDIRAVMDAADSERAALIGQSEGGPLSMLFAAAYPERTEALILAGAEVRERRDEEWPWGEASDEELEEAMATIPERLGKGGAFRHLAPDVGDVPWGREWLGKVQRNAGTPGSIEAFMRMAFDIDVRSVAPAINVPTLVFHASRDEICHVENGRFLARTIPGARYVEVDAADHIPWFGLADPFVDEVREFLTGERTSRVTDRVLATVLFTDIVGSTQRAATVGDGRWRESLDEHHAIVQAAVEQYGGRTVDLAGDGALATFDGPARAIHAARAIQKGSAPLGLEIRAGVHVGEVERSSTGIAGIAVHLGARVAAAAGPGEVWVSAIVPHLASGSGIGFVDRGSHHLKGLEGDQRLFSVSNEEPEP